MLDTNPLLGAMEVKPPSSSSLILLHLCWKQDESAHEAALRDNLSEATSHPEAHLAPERWFPTPSQQKPRSWDPLYNSPSRP